MANKDDSMPMGRNGLPELPESVASRKKMELNELAQYAAKDYDQPKQLSKLGKVVRQVEEEWPELEEYKSTNAFGLPKNRPSAALNKQEWPPREFEPIQSDSSVPAVTNALDLPKHFSVPKDSEQASSWFPQEAQNLVENPDSEDFTNAFGMPKNWYEQRQKELEKQKQEENSVVPKVSEEELEEIRANAHKKGYDAGYKSGLKAGHDEGVPIGIEEGKKQGFDEGYQQGMEQAKQEMMEKVQYFEQVLDKLAIPEQNLDCQIADSLVNLALNLTEQLVHLGVDRSKTFIVKSINEAIAMLPVMDQGVSIVVNQHDRDIIAMAYSDEELAKRKWKVSVDNALNNGDLLVEAKDSSVSVTLEQKIQELVRGFVSANLQQS